MQENLYIYIYIYIVKKKRFYCYTQEQEIRKRIGATSGNAGIAKFCLYV